MSDIVETLVDIFKKQAMKPFLIQPETKMEHSYEDFLCRAASVAVQLRKLGLQKGDRIGFELSNSINYVYGYWGALLAGVTAVPLNQSIPRKDYNLIVKGTRVASVITDDSNRFEYVDEENNIRCLHASNVFLNDQNNFSDSLQLLKKIDPSAIFSIHFTSGTTSLPKGVAHRVSSLLDNAMQFNMSFGIPQESRFFHVMSMSYMAGFLNTILCPLMAGGSVVCGQPFNAKSALHYWDDVAKCEATVLWLSPTMLATLVGTDRGETGKRYCNNTRVIVLSATAPLPMKIRRDFEAKYETPVIESYGLSELLLLTANLGHCASKDASVGVPIAGVEIEIRDEKNHPLSTNSEGAIWVKTPNASPGYIDYDTGEITPSGSDWVDTGDIGLVDKDGYLFITGRRKDIIIRGGMNVSPRCIEELIVTHKAVQDVAVFGIPHPFYGEGIVAAWTLKAGFELTGVERELRELCVQQLGMHAVPDRFVLQESFPVTSTGKIQKSILRDMILKSHST